MDEIDQFWRWWKGVADGFATAFDSRSRLSDAQISDITRHVKAMGDLAWETGPGTERRHHFALSAEGDAQLRVVTQRWLARAPRSDTWEFYAARQASAFSIGASIELGALVFTLGEFTLRIIEDDDRERFDLVVHHPLFAQLDDDACYRPIFLALDGALGEDEVVRWIGAIDLCREPIENAADLGVLRERLDAVRGEWKGDKTWLIKGETATGKPLRAVMNPSIKRLDHLFCDHHYSLCLDLVDVLDSGLPDSEEEQDLDEFADELMAELGHAAVWVGHETYEGKRLFHFHADASPALQQKIEDFVTLDGRWDAELSIEHDPSWEILRKY